MLSSLQFLVQLMTHIKLHKVRIYTIASAGLTDYLLVDDLALETRLQSGNALVRGCNYFS